MKRNEQSGFIVILLAVIGAVAVIGWLAHRL
jgi:hypothetical protein